MIDPPKSQEASTDCSGDCGAAMKTMSVGNGTASK